MRRIGLAVVLALILAPLAAQSQQTGKVWKVGYLGTAPPAPASLPNWDAFVQELRARGYVEGRNLIIERRYSEGKPERFPDFAAEFVRLKVDVIVASTTPAVKAAKQASSTIPIVTVYVGDPIGSGLVASLARPGGNVTGTSTQGKELRGKQLEVLHELVPSATRIAVIWEPAIPPHLPSLKDIEAVGRALHIDVNSYPVRTAEDFETMLAAIVRDRAMGLLPFDGQVTFVQRRRLFEFAARTRLPAVYATRTYVSDGGLMSYGPSLADLFRKAAVFVDRILKGAKPADLPVEQPTKFELIINLKTAKALGLTIPPSLLLRADQVIE
jgi:putative ABC transport system substrate-binding protein